MQQELKRVNKKFIRRARVSSVGPAVKTVLQQQFVIFFF